MFLDYDDVSEKPLAQSTPPKENKSKIRVKEMSVLQLKLTKLAIQIGYIGKMLRRKTLTSL